MRYNETRGHWPFMKAKVGTKTQGETSESSDSEQVIATPDEKNLRQTSATEVKSLDS